MPHTHTHIHYRAAITHRNVAETFVAKREALSRNPDPVIRARRALARSTYRFHCTYRIRVFFLLLLLLLAFFPPFSAFASYVIYRRADIQWRVADIARCWVCLRALAELRTAVQRYAMVKFEELWWCARVFVEKLSCIIYFFYLMEPVIGLATGFLIISDIDRVRK